LRQICITLLLMTLAVTNLGAQMMLSEARRRSVQTAALDIMRTARYCTLVTIGADGQPQARIVDPFVPEADLTIWIATNAASRKVDEVRRDPRVTLLYFNAAASEYVTLVGTAVVSTDAKQKAAHWKPDWAAFYKDQNKGDDYVLIRVVPSRLEVVSEKRGIRNDPQTWRPTTIEIPRP